jgi:uncharacterized sulfatase
VDVNLKRPHIVLLILDTHRRDRFGIYGRSGNITPNLDAFASRSVVFDMAISPAQWTIPAHASMFTGEYPTTHLTVQSSDKLSPAFATLADLLRRSGYRTIGFCNNPLVGVLDNQLKRGFETFYNYGGAVPSLPAREVEGSIRLLARAWEKYTQLLRRISYPVQNAVARSDRVFQITMHPMLVPLWTRYAHFKGDTRRSLQDGMHYFRKHLRPLAAGSGNPQFVFINMMETHLPFTPPEPFLSRFAPVYKEERAARDFMRVYNTQAARWLLPMETPFEPLEAQTLSQMYDAETAYQDYLLGQLLEELDQPFHRENTLVLIAADHGEMLGEHQLMGHGLGVYEELIHVPLMVRFPGQETGQRQPAPVSTTQVFHTLLAESRASEIESVRAAISDKEVAHLSLRRWLGSKPAPGMSVVSESYPPANVIRILERQKSALMEKFAVRSIFRALYDGGGNKYVSSEDGQEWYFRPGDDPGELEALAENTLAFRGERLRTALALFLEKARQRRPSGLHRDSLAVNDERLKNRLRSLGYLE